MDAVAAADNVKMDLWALLTISVCQNDHRHSQVSVLVMMPQNQRLICSKDNIARIKAKDIA